MSRRLGITPACSRLPRAQIVTLSALRVLARAAAPAGKRARLSVLFYHRVLPAPDPMRDREMDADTFGRLMTALAMCFRVLPLSEAVARLKAGTLPDRAVTITFDDGYADNHDVALPILQCLGLPATFFVTTGFLGGDAMWNDVVIESLRQWTGPELDLRRLNLGRYQTRTVTDRRAVAAGLLEPLKYMEPQEREATAREIASVTGATIPEGLMMTEQQVRELRAAGMEVGGHTVTHPILTRVSDEDAREEISNGRRILEVITGAPVTLFAYPNGKPKRDFGARHVSMVRELGFSAAVSTAWGVSTRDTNLFELRRFTPWDRHPVRFCLRLLQNCVRKTSANGSA